MSLLNVESMYDTIRKTVNTLSDVEKAVFYGRVEGKSFQTIADEMESSYDNIYRVNESVKDRLNVSYRQNLKDRFGRKIV